MNELEKIAYDIANNTEGAIALIHIGWPELEALAKDYLRLRALAAQQVESERTLEEHFEFLWESYALADDSTLTFDAQELKQRLRRKTGVDVLREQNEKLIAELETANEAATFYNHKAADVQLLLKASEERNEKLTEQVRVLREALS